MRCDGRVRSVSVDANSLYLILAASAVDGIGRSEPSGLGRGRGCSVAEVKWGPRRRVGPVFTLLHHRRGSCYGVVIGCCSGSGRKVVVCC
ncbi:hypothetical protein FOZ63_008622 [Perkinsus olseni]|uniref:Uncharacterized protein n=1 Tax=Perkinsus olseni TaxID=32597 RepID=A0A7J6SY53_PEROL|nr:hypothetical protein FOZ63_008622 [Perkinsus olseni]